MVASNYSLTIHYSHLKTIFGGLKNRLLLEL